MKTIVITAIMVILLMYAFGKAYDYTTDPQGCSPHPCTLQSR